MALKKSELYAFLWASCDELRGGMDASQYKDYVLTLLFLKYVSDKYAGQPFDALQRYWQVCPQLRATLFGPCRPGYRTLRVAPEAIRATITGHPEFAAFVARAEAHFQAWRQRWSAEAGSGSGERQASGARAAVTRAAVTRAAEAGIAYQAAATPLRSLAAGFQPKELIAALSEDLLAHHRERPLLDPYAVYQHLMDYWSEQMQDDAYLISADGWRAEPYRVIETDKKGKERDKGWACDLVPKALLVARCFAAEQAAIDELQSEQEASQAAMDELAEEHGGEDGAFAELEKVTKATVAARLKELAGTAEPQLGSSTPGTAEP
ncbi:MAG: type I restriction-modification system subunit M N-terminal domain-containing protein, partial [Planctomycetota bacterium]